MERNQPGNGISDQRAAKKKGLTTSRLCVNAQSRCAGTAANGISKK
jgi:hypothetical protein